MTRFYNKKLSFGFVIISPEHNVGRLLGTVRSIRNHYTDVSIVCATGDDTTASELKEMKAVCPTHRGKGTITSLLNTGISKGHKEWNIIVTEGTWVKQKVDQKFSYWIEDEKDVLYPIVVDYDRDGKPIKIYKDFEECTLNGICLNQKFFKEIGQFSENQLDISKKFWALEAVEKGGKFKAVLGASMI